MLGEEIWQGANSTCYPEKQLIISESTQSNRCSLYNHSISSSVRSGLMELQEQDPESWVHVLYLPHNIELWVQTLVWAPFPIWGVGLDKLYNSFQLRHAAFYEFSGYSPWWRLWLSLNISYKKSTPKQGAAANRHFSPTQILNVNTQFTYKKSQETKKNDLMEGCNSNECCLQLTWEANQGKPRID